MSLSIRRSDIEGVVAHKRNVIIMETAKIHLNESIQRFCTYEIQSAAPCNQARNLTDKAYVSSVVVDDANGRFFEPGDGRAFYGGISYRWR